MISPLATRINEVRLLADLMETMPSRLLEVLNRPTHPEDTPEGVVMTHEYYIYLSGFASKEVDITPNNVEFARKLVGALELSAGWEQTSKTKRATTIDVMYTHKDSELTIKVSDWRPKTCRIIEKEVEEVIEATEAREAMPARTITKTVQEMICD